MSLSQDSPAVAGVQKEIEEHRNSIAEYEASIKRLEDDKKNQEDKLSRIKLNLDVLIKALAILKGTPEVQEAIQESLALSEQAIVTVTTNLVPGSNSFIARKALVQEGRSLKMPALFAKGQELKPELNKRSFGANVYRLAAEGKVFRVKDKKISLLEWENK